MFCWILLNFDVWNKIVMDKSKPTFKLYSEVLLKKKKCLKSTSVYGQRTPHYRYNRFRIASLNLYFLNGWLLGRLKRLAKYDCVQLSFLAIRKIVQRCTCLKKKKVYESIRTQTHQRMIHIKYRRSNASVVKWVHI